MERSGSFYFQSARLCPTAEAVHVRAFARKLTKKSRQPRRCGLACSCVFRWISPSSLARDPTNLASFIIRRFTCTIETYLVKTDIEATSFGHSRLIQSLKKCSSKKLRNGDCTKLVHKVKRTVYPRLSLTNSFLHLRFDGNVKNLLQS